VQVDVIIHAAKSSIEPPSIPAQGLAPFSNVAVRLWNNEAAVKERREASLL
jgi:hypothetical protein